VVAESAVAEVVLVDYPVQLGMREMEHTDELIREFQLLAAAADQSDRRLDLPRRLIELVTQLTTTSSVELSEPTERRLEAAERGDTRMTLRYPVLPETAAVAGAWEGMMAEVDEFCRQGDLLTLETPPDLVRLRAWLLGEFREQLAGRPPTPWPGPHPGPAA